MPLLNFSILSFTRCQIIVTGGSLSDSKEAVKLASTNGVMIFTCSMSLIPRPAVIVLVPDHCTHTSNGSPYKLELLSRSSIFLPQYTTICTSRYSGYGIPLKYGYIICILLAGRELDHSQQVELI